MFKHCFNECLDVAAGLTVKASREIGSFSLFCLPASLEERFVVEDEEKQYTVCVNHVVNLSIRSYVILNAV